MNHYLVVFDRSTGTLVRVEQCSDSQAALKARFRAEREYDGNESIEIVVLGAKSEDALQTTHGRYFSSVADLASLGSKFVRASKAHSLRYA